MGKPRTVITSNFKEFNESAARLTAQQVSDIMFGDFEKLQQALNSITNNLDIIRNHYIKANKHSGLKGQIQDLYSAMRYEEGAVNDILQQQHFLEESLNKFLGRKIYITYVTEDGKVLFGDDIVVQELYGKATAQIGRGNIGEDKMTEELFEKSKDEILISIRQQLNDSAQRKQTVYQTALLRYKDKNKKYKKNSELIKTYWWQKQAPDPENEIGWTGKINNIGDIAEGYVQAVVEEQFNNWDATSNTQEFYLYWLWNHYIERNTTPAIIRGDVVAKNDGSLQFAVKSGSFSTARLGQYYRFAKNIQKLKFLTPEDLLNDNNSKFKTLISSSDAAEKLIEKMNKEFEESISKDKVIEI